MEPQGERVEKLLYLCIIILLLVACRPGPSENKYGIPRFLEQLMIEDAVASLAAGEKSDQGLTARSLTYVGYGRWGPGRDFYIYSSDGEEVDPPSGEEFIELMWPREHLVRIEGITYDLGDGLVPAAERVVCYYVTITVAGRRSPALVHGIAYGHQLARRRWMWRYRVVGEDYWHWDSCPGEYPIENTD